MMALAGVAVLALFLVRTPGNDQAAVDVADRTAVEEVASPALKTATLDKQDVERLDKALEDLEMLHVLGSTGGAAQANAL